MFLSRAGARGAGAAFIYTNNVTGDRSKGDQGAIMEKLENRKLEIRAGVRERRGEIVVR